MSQSDRLKPFRDGLYRILLAGDVPAFGRYLRQWEDLIGDTAELAETSEAQQRRTMEALLRRPQQYGLPPWPREIPVPAEPRAESQEQPDDQGEEHSAGQPIDLPASAGLPLVADASHDVPVNKAWADAEIAKPDLTARTILPTPETDEPGSFYQVDMMTGELVPVESISVRAPHRQLEHVNTAQATLSAGVTRNRRRRRQRLTPGMTQLTMWSDDEPTG